jgi:serine/threonine protein kinase
MGNNNNAVAGVQVYRTSRPGEWVRQGTTGYCDIVKNAQTGEIAEQYSIPIDQGLSFEEELRLYEMRRNQPRIVRVLQVEKENTTHFCQGQEFLRVKTEHIPKRLSDFEKLSHNEGFYVLLEVLRGYQAIHRFQPRFTINREMVGFTPEGQVRVWLNENFAKNSPDLPRVQRSQRPNVRP